MGDIDNFIDTFADGGVVVDRTNVFTIDFRKQALKLAKFQLVDRNEFILKLVQAANIAADELVFSGFSGSFTVTLTGWDPRLDFDKMAERLSSTDASLGNDAIAHLLVAVSTLLPVAENGIILTFYEQGRNGYKAARLTDSWHQEDGTLREPSKFSGLTFSVPYVKGLNVDIIRKLLYSRCFFSTIPLKAGADFVKPRFPTTQGRHRSRDFTINHSIGERCYLPQGAPLPTTLTESEGIHEAESIPRLTWMRMTVDLDPLTTVTMTQAGVQTSVSKVDLGIPGLSVVVASDDATTDLTGLQIVKGQTYEEILAWVKQASEGLLDEAIENAGKLKHQEQEVGTIEILPTLLSLGKTTLYSVSLILYVVAIQTAIVYFGFDPADANVAAFASAVLIVLTIRKYSERSTEKEDNKPSKPARTRTVHLPAYEKVRDQLLEARSKLKSQEARSG